MTILGYEVQHEFIEAGVYTPEDRGYHLFTSKEVYGVFSMAHSFRKARDGAESQMKYLLARNKKEE